MNNYRSKSKKYRIFIRRSEVNQEITEIVVYKLTLRLVKVYQKDYFARYSYLDSEAFYNCQAQKPKGHSIWSQINHFVIEDGLIDILKSRDKETVNLGIEILKLKISERENPL